MNLVALRQALSLVVERRAFGGPFDDAAARSIVRDAEAVVSRHLSGRVRAIVSCSAESSDNPEAPVLVVTLIDPGRPVQTLRFDLQNLA